MKLLKQAVRLIAYRLRYPFSATDKLNGVEDEALSQQKHQTLKNNNDLESSKVPSTSQTSSNSPKITLSENAQRAIWASQIIETIRSSRQSTQQRTQSLRDRLIELQIKDCPYELKQAIKEQLIGIFINGAFLDPNIFTQQRIHQGGQDRKNLFIFCPTYFVTKKIFENILFGNKDVAIFGSYGTGKSTAIVLYIYLAEIINKYRYEATLPQNKEKLGKELQLLLKEELIVQSAKYWYWSIDTTTDIDTNTGLKEPQVQELNINKLIYHQATELPIDLRQKLLKCGSLKELKQMVQEYYRKSGIILNIAIDQINAAISYFRDWNFFILNYNRQKQKGDKDMQEQLEKNLIYHQTQSKIPGLRLLKEIHTLKPFGSKYVINSSVNVQKQLIWKKEKSFTDDGTYTLGLSDSHKTPRQIEMVLKKYWKTGEAQSQFTHFYWFEVSRRLDSIISKKTMEAIKKWFYDEYKISMKLSYRILYIRQFLNQFGSQLKQIESESIQQITSKIKQILDQFPGYCLKKNIQRIKKFINKGIDQNEKLEKLRFMFILHWLAQYLAENDRQILMFRVAQLNNAVTLPVRINQYLRSAQHNKQLLPIDFSQGDDIVNLHWSPTQFIQIFTPVIQALLFSKDNNFLLSQPIKTAYSSDNGTRGKIFEAYFLAILKHLPEMIIMEAYRKEHQIQFKPRSFNITQEVGFKRLNIPKQNFNQQTTEIPDNLQGLTGSPKLPSFKPTIKQNLQKILQKAKANVDSWIAGIPKFQQGPLAGQFDRDSQCIDFLLVRYNQVYTIETFDISVANSEAVVEKKLKDANQFFRYFGEQIKQHNFIVKHHIICPPHLCEKKAEDGVIEIMLSSVDDIKFQKLNKLDYLPIFCGLQQINKDFRKIEQLLSAKKTTERKAKKATKKEINKQFPK